MWNFQNPISTQNPKEIRIGKTPPILHILERYTRSEDQTISPSALNTYMECSLKFYFKYIAQIKEKEELAEELDQITIENNEVRYDAAVDFHGHFKCMKCGALYDINLDPEGLPDKIDGHSITERHYYFKGICNNCSSR